MGGRANEDFPEKKLYVTLTLCHYVTMSLTYLLTYCHCNCIYVTVQ